MHNYEYVNVTHCARKLHSFNVRGTEKSVANLNKINIEIWMVIALLEYLDHVNGITN